MGFSFSLAISCAVVSPAAPLKWAKASSSDPDEDALFADAAACTSPAAIGLNTWISSAPDSTAADEADAAAEFFADMTPATTFPAGVIFIATIASPSTYRGPAYEGSAASRQKRVKINIFFNETSPF